MQITVDEESLDVDDGLSVLEILAQVSDRVQAARRLVVSLRVGDCFLTDRDLTPGFLSKTGREVGALAVGTRAIADVMEEADQAARRYGALLHADGRQLLRALRGGRAEAGRLEHWLVRLADYVECAGGTDPGRTQVPVLVEWLAKLLDAHAAADPVTVTDLLEHEVLPRLPS
ncbi:hypothetical protein [Candidatus Nitrospira bockiana]